MSLKSLEEQKLQSVLLYCWCELIFHPNISMVETQIYRNCEDIVSQAMRNIK